VTDPGAKQHDPQVQVARINRTGTIITAVIGGVVTVTAAVITGVVTHNNDVSGAASAAPTTVTVSVPAPAAAPGPDSSSSPAGPPAADGGQPVWNLPSSGSGIYFSTGPQTVVGQSYPEALYSNDSILCGLAPYAATYQTDGKYNHFTAKVAATSGNKGTAAVFSLADANGGPLGNPVTVQVGQPPQDMDVSIDAAQQISLIIAGPAGSGCMTETGMFIDPEVS
jgi:hypothetical protein